MTTTTSLGRTARQLRSAVLVAAVVAGSLALSAGPASASGKTSAGGDYRVTIGSTTYDPAPGKSVKVSGIVPSGRIAVRGVNNGFDIDVATLGVYDYTLTGAPDTQRMVTKPTVVFASKVPTLTAAQLAGATITRLEVKDDTLVVLFSSAGGTFKIQAKDGAQGGIFQMESEFGAPVEFTHTLGAGLCSTSPTSTRARSISATASTPSPRVPERTRCCSARTAPRSRRRPCRPAPSRSGSSSRAAASGECSARTRSS